MVEREVDDAAVIAADAAGTSRLLNEDLLELLLAPRNRLADAALALPAVAAARTPAVLRELGHTVSLAAMHLYRPLSPRVRRAPAIPNKWDWGLQFRVNAAPLPRHDYMLRAGLTKYLQIAKKVPPPGLEPGLRD
jgi:hypothetical protein